LDIRIMNSVNNLLYYFQGTLTTCVHLVRDAERVSGDWVCDYGCGRGAGGEWEEEWVRNCACLQIFSWGKPSGKLPLGILRSRREPTLKIDCREVACEGGSCMRNYLWVVSSSGL
jgi:hypothetical protein